MCVCVCVLPNRKRRRSCDSEDGQVLPQAKRPGGGNALLPDLGRDAWDSEVREPILYLFYSVYLVLVLWLLLVDF